MEFTYRVFNMLVFIINERVSVSEGLELLSDVAINHIRKELFSLELYRLLNGGSFRISGSRCYDLQDISILLLLHDCRTYEK